MLKIDDHSDDCSPEHLDRKTRVTEESQQLQLAWGSLRMRG